MKLGYSVEIGAEEHHAQVAKRLLMRKYRATKGGTDFNRRLVYPKSGISNGRQAVTVCGTSYFEGPLLTAARHL